MSSDTRWYDRTSGCIIDSVPMKTPVKLKDENGEFTGETRTHTKSTLVHAKKMGLLPSVTSVIDGVLTGGAGLEKWKMEQRILASISNPFTGDAEVKEDVASYIRLINGKAEEFGKSKAERGNVMHGDLYEWIISDRTEMPDDPASKEMCIQLHSFFESKKVVSLSTEVSISSPELGFAGTPDVFCTCEDGSNIVVDLKTADFAGKKISYYDKWKMQLGAYRNLIPNVDEALLVQAVADRTHGDVVIKEYDEDYVDYSAGFTHLLNVFCIIKNYDPRKFLAA